jgi:hypothetical protein
MYFFDGASGSRYVYGKLDLEKLLALGWSIPSGNFILTKDYNGTVDIVYVGESSDVWNALTLTPIWPEARQSHGANTIYAHPASDAALREREALDLIEQWHPPMNVPDKAAQGLE